MEGNATLFENVSNDVIANEVKNMLQENYDIVVKTMKRLDGYDDLNFQIIPLIEKTSNVNNHTQVCVHGYVLKIFSWENSTNIEFISEYINLLLHLSLDPSALQSLERIHVVLLLEYIPGKLLNDVSFGKKFCFSLGQIIGRLHHAMKPFSNSKVLQRPHFVWSLKYVTDTLKYTKFVEEEVKRSMVTKAIVDFQNEVLPHMNELEQGIIHGDLNKANLVIFERSAGSEPELYGIIDFSDISHSCYLFDLAITILYLSMDQPDNIESFTASVLSGYSRKMSDLELNLMKTCICARIAQSLILGLYAYHSCPSNTYVLTTQKQGWPLLEKLQNQTNESFIANITEKITF
ncbi:hydroxylysine kinase isoform X2 [Planococcus citri]|uniref:hydroxylysine kinase isoform X2 n=1 Tax=Planococcus citri TaxID=170843 RepID=UPI0031F75960